MPSERIEITPDVVAHLARAAGLPLRPERAKELAPLVEGILKAVITLEKVDVSGYEPPAVFRYPRRSRSAR